MPSLSARDYVQAKRGGRATSVRVQPTGTAVTDYQVSLGQRHSLREAGVIGLPSWSERSTQTETWVKVPRLSATCPRRVIAFDGGVGNIDRCMDFGDDFDGTTINTAKWTVIGTQIVSGSWVMSTGATGIPSGLASKLKFGVDTSLLFRASVTTSTDNACVIGWEFGTYPLRVLTQTGVRLQGAATQAIGMSSGVVYTWDIRRIGNVNSMLYVDGAYVITDARNTTDTKAIDTYASDGIKGRWTINWVAVRKYIAPEPLSGTAKPSATNRALSRPLNHAGLIRACCAA